MLSEKHGCHTVLFKAKSEGSPQATRGLIEDLHGKAEDTPLPTSRALPFTGTSHSVII